MNLFFLKRPRDLLVIGLFFLCALTAQAQITSKIDNLVVDAESMTRDTKAQMIYLNGSVHVIYQGQHIRCDNATINLKTKMIDAAGHMTMVSPKMRAMGTRGTFNYEDNTGVLYDGFVEMGTISFEGKVIYKTGENKFEAVEANYTACTTCPPAWQFSGTTMKATVGGYAYITNGVLYVSHVPVLWFPYMVIPILSKRQTGLLQPTYGFGGDSGFFFEESLFWARSEDTDGTFSFKNYAHRGQKYRANYRYVLTPDSKGELDFGLIQDKYFAGYLTNRGYRPVDGSVPTRGFIKYNHYYDMPEGLVQRVQLNNATDNRYQRDFSEDLQGQGDPALESKASLTKNTDTQHISVEADYAHDLLKSDPRGDNDDAVHRMPSVLYSLAPQKNFRFLTF